MAAKLIIKSLVLLALVGLMDVCFLRSPAAKRTLTQDYLAGWSLKHRLLLGEGEGRLIVLGGSNVAFGVDSTLLERVTGRKTINLGLHAGLGLDHMLNEAADGARRGDLVLLIPEYEQFFGGQADGEMPVAELLMYDLSSLRYVKSWPQWHRLVGSVAAMSGQTAFDVINNAQRQLRGYPSRPTGHPVYRRDAFNAHGDVVSHLSQPPRPANIAKPSEIIASINPAATKSLHRFMESLDARGARLLVTYPSVTARFLELNRDQIFRAVREMQTPTTRSRPEEWVFDESLFQDTWYHLNREGRRLRSERLARLVSAFDKGQSEVSEAALTATCRSTQSPCEPR